MASWVPIARRKGRYRDEETYLRFGYRDRSLRTNIRRNVSTAETTCIHTEEAADSRPHLPSVLTLALHASLSSLKLISQYHLT
jgi:hypothetical protein